MHLAPPRILCVEDHEAISDLLETFLSAAGYEVIITHTLAAGLAAARSRSFSLYLLDYMLPGGSGVFAGSSAFSIRALRSSSFPPSPKDAASQKNVKGKHQRFGLL